MSGATLGIVIKWVSWQTSDVQSSKGDRVNGEILVRRFLIIRRYKKLEWIIGDDLGRGHRCRQSGPLRKVSCELTTH